MKNLETEIGKNWQHMSYQTYRAFKQKLLDFSDKEIADMYYNLEWVYEYAGELYSCCDCEEDFDYHHKRTKYIYKLLEFMYESADREHEKYLNIPIEVHIQKADDEILLAMNEFKVNDTTMTQDLKNLVCAELAARGIS